MSASVSLEKQLVRDRDRGLFLIEQINAGGLIQAGFQTVEIQTAIYSLVALLYSPGKKPRFWHKQVLRVGEDTVNSYSAEVKNLTVCAGDVVFFDLGPVFDVEADIGRTVIVPGTDIDPDKFKIRTDVERLFSQGKDYYLKHQNMTGRDLYEYIRFLAADNGWKLSEQYHTGHLIGQFPHERILGDTKFDYICPANTLPMNAPDKFGNKRYWILEVHLVHPQKPFGAFYEDLLNL